MNYDQALAVAKEHAPKLLVDPEVKGQPHICVRKEKDGVPFSIHLVTTTVESGDPEVVFAASEGDKKTLTDALDAAMKTLGVV